MFRSDTVDKIITTYFAAVTDETFTYKDKTYEPKLLKVSLGVFRDFTCPEGCGGCCFKFTLDYLPRERQPYALTRRFIDFNGRKIAIDTDYQDDNDSLRCRNLRSVDGRCGIHGAHPFSCDFELIRFTTFEEAKDVYKYRDVPDTEGGTNRIDQRLFGRGWSYRRTDGSKGGAKCEITDVSDRSRAETNRKLKRLRRWSKHFRLKTRLDEIIAWAETDPSEDRIFDSAGIADEDWSKGTFG